MLMRSIRPTLLVAFAFQIIFTFCTAGAGLKTDPSSIDDPDFYNSNTKHGQGIQGLYLKHQDFVTSPQTNLPDDFQVLIQKLQTFIFAQANRLLKNV